MQLTLYNILCHLKWYVVPGFVSGYYFFTLEQQKVQLLHPRLPNGSFQPVSPKASLKSPQILFKFPPFMSMKGANPENFFSLLYQFLLVFKNFKVSMNSLHFMKLGFVGLRNLKF